MKCPRCGGSNIFKSTFNLDMWSCNDCPDPNTFTSWQQAIITEKDAEISRLQAEVERLTSAAQAVIDYRQRAGALGLQVEKLDDYLRLLQTALKGA